MIRLSSGISIRASWIPTPSDGNVNSPVELAGSGTVTWRRPASFPSRKSVIAEAIGGPVRVLVILIFALDPLRTMAGSIVTENGAVFSGLETPSIKTKTLVPASTTLLDSGEASSAILE